MNNTAFRRLVLDTPSRSSSTDDPKAPASLGSRMRPSIPMTPRSIASSSTNEFAKQLAQRNAELNPSGVKKFRSSAAPKGTKLAAGYQDRTKLRDSVDGDEKAKRVQALEEMVKLGQMDEATFHKLRDEIVGGNVENAHLVKGLDFKLLRKMRDGSGTTEDTFSEHESAFKTLTDADLEDEFEKVETQTVAPLVKEEKAKSGVMAPPASRNRDEILKNLRAARDATALDKKASQPSLGSKFKKLGEKREASRIEIDEQGREVLILVDADGKVKRKIKKVTASPVASGTSALPAPDKNVAPLGMEVPLPRKMPTPPPAEDLDIFDGVGTDFNPLQDEGHSDGGESASDSSSNFEVDDKGEEGQVAEPNASKSGEPVQGSGTNIKKPRNYFGDDPKPEISTKPNLDPLNDPQIRAAVKKASALQAGLGDTPNDAGRDEKLQKRKRLLDTHDRDAEDMDLGFGGSRLGDDEDFEDGKRVKLSVWGQEKEGDQSDPKGAKQARKRGPKKKKGDANSMSDIFKVIDRRKAAK